MSQGPEKIIWTKWSTLLKKGFLLRDLFVMLRITVCWFCSVQLFKTPASPKKSHRFWNPHESGAVILFSVSIAVIWHCRKCNDNFWSNCVVNSPRRKWLVNHCPLSHFAHGELAGLGTHWVVAVLSDSCGAQCLKLSSNVWHMVCHCGLWRWWL